MWYMSTSESGAMTVERQNAILKENSIDGKITWSPATLNAAETASDAQVVIGVKVVCTAHATASSCKILVLAH
jgi:hypothetical protein